MNESDPNPYQPPGGVRAGALDTEQIRISGQVVQKDIELLIRRSVLFQILHFVSAIIVALLGSVLVAALVRPVTARALPVAIIMLVLLGLGWVNWFFLRRSRARRLVRRFPDLVGPIDGYLDAFGLTFYSADGTQAWQYSWAAFTKITVTDAGVSLSWPNGFDYFIGVPGRIIDGFGANWMRERIAAFESAANGPAVMQVKADWSDVPAEAIRFQNLVLTKAPPERRDKQIAYASNALMYVLMLGMGAAWFINLGTTMWLVGLTLVGVGIVQIKYNTKLAPAPFVFRQWGWIAEDHVQTHLPGATSRFDWQQAARIEFSEKHLLASFSDGTSFYAASEDLLDGDWSTIQGWLRPSGESGVTVPS